MSTDPKSRGRAAAVLRALLLDSSRYAGPREPDSPQPLARLLAGGEWRGWDVRTDVCLRATAFLSDHPHLRARTTDRVGALLQGATPRTLRAAIAALRAEARRDGIPSRDAGDCLELADVLTLALAEQGDRQAGWEAAGIALHVAATQACVASPGSWLYLRAALRWAHWAASADVRNDTYVPEPLYPDLAEEDAKLAPLAEALAIAREGLEMIHVEDAILKGGAGVAAEPPPELPADSDPPDLGDGHTNAGEPERSAGPPSLVVFPSLSHLPEPTKGARDRGESPRALIGDLAQQELPLVQAPDPAVFRRAFLAAVPWAEEAADAYANDLVGAPYAAFRPRILVGPPGEGKTASARLLFQLAGLDATVYGAAGQMDGGAFAGTSRQWGTWRLSTPAQAILRAQRGTVGIVVDEVEKAGDSRRWGRLDETLLPYVERHTARAIHDPALEAPIDLSAVSYILTANSLDGLSGPLRDRCQVLRWQGPRREHLPFVAGAIVREIRTERGLDASWYPDLAPNEIDALDWWRGGSLRPLRRAVEAILAARDVFTPRH